MIDLIINYFDILILSCLCFMGGFLLFPFVNSAVSFGLKIIIGVYSTFFYLMSTYFFINNEVFSYLSIFEFSFLMFIFLFFFSYLLSLVIHFSISKIDSNFL